MIEYNGELESKQIKGSKNPNSSSRDDIRRERIYSIRKESD